MTAGGDEWSISTRRLQNGSALIIHTQQMLWPRSGSAPTYRTVYNVGTMFHVSMNFCTKLSGFGLCCSVARCDALPRLSPPYPASPPPPLTTPPHPTPPLSQCVSVFAFPSVFLCRCMTNPPRVRVLAAWSTVMDAYRHILSSWFPTVWIQKRQWNKMSKWHTHTQIQTVHTDMNTTHTHIHKHAAFMDSVSTLEAVKTKACSVVSWLHPQRATSQVIFCLLVYDISVSVLVYPPSSSSLLFFFSSLSLLFFFFFFSHSLPPRSCSSMCLSVKFFPVMMKISLSAWTFVGEIMTELIQYHVIDIYIYSIL